MTTEAPTVAQSDIETSIWAPLRVRALRAMYIAVLVSNIGTWMQTVEEDPGRTQVELAVNAASIDTHHAPRDQDLRSARFFDVEAFPTMSYRSSLAAYDGDGRWDIDGQLTIRDITRPVRLQAWFRGTTVDTGGHTRVGFHAAARLRRQDFNLIADLAREVGTLPVGTDVNIEADIEATLRNSPKNDL